MPLLTILRPMAQSWYPYEHSGAHAMSVLTMLRLMAWALVPLRHAKAHAAPDHALRPTAWALEAL